MKIINCITNSFFRTIGRVLAYLAIGGIIVAILSKAKLPSVDSIANDIFFAKVNASSFVSLNTGSMKWSTTYNGSYTSMSYQDSRYYTGNASLTSNQRYYLKLDSSKTNLASSYNYIYVNVLFRNLTPDTLSNNASYTTSCEITDTEMQNDGGIYIPDLGNGLYEYLEYKGFECETNVVDGTQELYHTTSGINLTYGSDSAFTQNPCIAVSQSGDNYVFKCPILDYARNLYGFVLRVNTSRASDIRFGVSDLLSVELNENQQIIDNQNQNTQQIINNQQAQTNATIENQNQNTQEQIDSQKICNFIDKANIVIDNKFLSYNGTETVLDGYGITDYINIKGSTIEIVARSLRGGYNAFYDTNKNFISSFNNSDLTDGQIINIPSTAEYVRFSIDKNSNRPTANICTNGNQALSNTITDSTAPDISSSLSNDTVAGWLPPGPIDSLVNLPLTLFNSITTAMGGTCSPLTVPLPFIDENISIPCMSGIYTDMGFGSFFNWIGVIASAFILFSYLMKLYKWVDDTLTFRENNHLDNWGGV